MISVVVPTHNSAPSLPRCFDGLIGATVSALSEKHLSGVKTSLMIAAVGGLAWLIATAFFAAGGAIPNIVPQAIN